MVKSWWSFYGYIKLKWTWTLFIIVCYDQLPLMHLMRVFLLHIFLSALCYKLFFCFFFLFGLSPTIRLQLDTRNSEPCELPKCVVKSIFKVLNGDASICFLFLKKFNKRLNSSPTSTPLFIFLMNWEALRTTSCMHGIIHQKSRMHGTKHSVEKSQNQFKDQ